MNSQDETLQLLGQHRAEPSQSDRDLSGEPLLLRNNLCFTMYSTVHALNRVYRPVLDELDLTYPQFLVMLVLWEVDNITVKEIGEQLFLDSGTLTPLLKRLETAGWVQRTRCPADERQVRITLTPDGRNLREKAKGIRGQVISAYGLPEEHMKRLNAELVELRQRLNAVAKEQGDSDGRRNSVNVGGGKS